MRNRELGLFNCIRHKSYTGMLVIANENKIGWHHDLVRPIDGAFLFGGVEICKECYRESSRPAN